MTHRTFVLVPGMSHGGWVWHPVARRLREAGHEAVAVTLPGLGDGDDPTGIGMADAVAHLVAEIRSRHLADVVLVGHSWGGYPITAAAHELPGVVRDAVYFSAVVPHRGVSMVDEFPPEAQAGVRATIAASVQGSISFPFEAVSQTLMENQPAEAQRLVFELLTPMPGGYLLEGVDVEPVTSAGVRAAYVLASDDRALVHPGREFAARLGLEPILVPGTHEALLTHPDEVGRAISAAAGREP